MRITLLTIIVLLIFPPALSSEDNEAADFALNNAPVVTVEIPPELPVTGALWAYTLIVDYPVPNDVTVISPSFTDFLFLDRIVKNPVTAGTQTQTMIQYRFIPVRAGMSVLEPFTIITPDGITETGRFTLNIQSPVNEQRPVVYRTVWNEYPRQTAAGERVEAALRITSPNAVQPPPEFFMPEVPRGAILSLLPVSVEEKTVGIVMKLALILLDGDFRLPARTLQYGNAAFEIPALFIRLDNVTLSGSITGERLQQNIPHNVPAVSVNEITRFPAFDYSALDKPYFKYFRDQLGDIYVKARNMWDNGLYALALAELRRNERNHPAGALLLSVRREAEESLMFFNTGNESRLRQIFIFGLLILFLLLVIISIFVCFIFFKRGKFGRDSLKTNVLKKRFFTVKRTGLLCAVIVTAFGFIYLYRFTDNSRFGVTEETAVRRTADTSTEELFVFREGQPVIIMLNSGSWVYVRANDTSGNSGWIPAEKVIFY